jgi:eukaryotic-like serine/threonine-protein kinase
VSSQEKSPTRALALGSLARVRVKEGRAAEALPLAEEAMAMLAAFGGVDEGEALMRLAHVEALLAVGQNDAAQAALRTARDRLNERAARIADPLLRRMFLDAVPENARTLALAETHLT